MALIINQINQFQLKYLRMAGFLEFVEQALQTGIDNMIAGVHLASYPRTRRASTLGSLFARLLYVSP